MANSDYIHPKLAVCWQQSDLDRIRRILAFSQNKLTEGSLLKRERQSYVKFVKAGKFLIDYFDGKIITCRNMPKSLWGHANAILDKL